MNWAHYLLQVNIYLLLFYCFYKILLAKETYFIFNRVYLVSAGILSLVIPFLRFEWFTRQEATQTIYQGVDQLNIFVSDVTYLPAPETSFNWGQLVVFIYLGGIVLFLLKLFIQLISLRKIMRSVASGHAFSFFSNKMIDPSLPSKEVISRHEDIHIRQLHSADVIFFELLSVLVWFNPVIYLYKHTLKSIHEYLADERAAAFQGSKEDYALLLLSKAFNVEPHVLTNNFFNRSLIKRRIFMLHKERSKKTAVLKYGLFVPLFGLTLALSAATIRENQKIMKVAESLPLLETVLETVENAPAILKDPGAKIDILFSGGKNSADLTDLRAFLATKLRYPAGAISKSLQGNSVIKFTLKNGKLLNIGVVERLGERCDEEVMNAVLSYNNFTAIKDGEYLLPVAFRLSGAKSPIQNYPAAPVPPGYELIKEIMVNSMLSNAKDQLIIRGFSKSPENQALIILDDETVQNSALSSINPNDIDAIKVLSGVEAKVLYGDDAKNGALLITTKGYANKQKEVVVQGAKVTSTGNDEKIYDYVNVRTLPEYPGGVKKFGEFIQKNIQYPAPALQAAIEGTAYVGFTVETDGSLTNVHVDRKVGYGMDEEAIRVVESSGKWVPGINADGKPVRVKFNFPVKFRLDKLAGTEASLNQEKIYDYVSIEKLPEYPGGIDQFRQYVSKNILYPKAAASQKIAGTVYVIFVVEKDGSLTNLKVDRRVGGGLDEEAMRVIGTSMKWKPGIMEGKPVRVKYNFPVKFTLK